MKQVYIYKRLQFFVSKVMLITMLFISCLIYGQSISGEVLDMTTKKPLENVNVFSIENNSLGTITNKKGGFLLDFKTKFKKTDSISFSMIGYKKFKVSILKLKNKNNVIYLLRTSSLLKEVIVKSKKKQAKLKYEKVSSLPSKIFSFASIIINDKLYISGGDQTNFENSFKKAAEKASMTYMEPTFRDVQRFWNPSSSFKKYSDKLHIYNIKNNSWEKTDIVCENRAYHEINYYQDKLYVIGGKKLSSLNENEYLHNKIEVYNVNNEKIQVDKTNPHQAINFASFVYKENLIIMGGSTGIDKSGNKIFTNKIHQYDLKTGYWYELGEMKKGKEVSGLVIEDKLYTIGGFDGDSVSFIEKWDLTTGKWTTEGEMFSGIKNPGLTHYKNEIYIYDNGSLMIYNTNLNTLKRFRVNLNLKNAAIHFHDDKLYIVGGFREKDSSKEPSLGVYTINLSEFNKTRVIDYKEL